ncbi:ABC transporter permease [Actinoplanes solisilvae]|uniref:ABC transporter permease n=1 Tax=Actinoplanes solisilvae TaxID=2486853 RepID=UPI000FD6EF5A|nr:ABC transporter permease [Actinoplanes solisilvae]
MSEMRAAIAAEWTKLWTTRTVWWALVAALVLMAAGAGQYAIYADNGDVDPALLRDGVVPPGTVAVLALAFAQLAFLALAMLVMTGEYSTGTMRATLTWIPARGRLLLAKSVVVAAVTFVAGTVAGLVGASISVALIGGRVSAGPVLGIGVYLALLGVFAVGLGAVLRGPVVTLVVLLMLVVVLPPLLQLPEIGVLTAIADGLPGVAGNHFLLGDSDPYAPGLGLLIVTGWAVAAFLAGRGELRRRDA